MSAFHIWTIGCQMNVADSRRLAESLEQYGLCVADGPREADVVVLYSCVVRQQAEDRVHGQLHALQQMKAARPAMKIVVAGCVSDIPDWRSRPPAVIVDEVKRLIDRGTREVVLLSQIVERYGRDLRPRVLLSNLLEQLDRLEGLERIRFLTSYPGDFGRDLVDAIADLPKVCEDVNLPIQSGDDGVLKRMKRGYVVDHYRRLIGRLRERVPEISLSTDIIVGFPGETGAEFDTTLRMLDEFRFDVVHVAMYSPRPGTVAATEMIDDVPREEKRRRLHEVELLQKHIAASINAHYLHRSVD